MANLPIIVPHILDPERIQDMPKLARALLFPTCILVAAVLAANAVISMVVVLVSDRPFVTTFLDACFLEAGLMMIVGGLAMMRSPKIEGRGSKILLAGFILFVLPAIAVVALM